MAPGIPGVDEQEQRDRVPRGTYRRIAETGRLRVAEGLNVPKVADLVDMITSAWGTPEVILCDRARLAELKDAHIGCPLTPRVTRWFDAAADIRATRKLAKDGPLAVDPESRLLVSASLSAALVKNDDQGSFRLVKRSNNVGRDDVAAALVLCCGAHERGAAAAPSWTYEGAA